MKPTLTRRNVLTTAAAGIPAAWSAESLRAAAGGRWTITRVKVVEVRGVVTGKGLVLPWDPKKEPHDTRDYVVAQFLTNQGLVGMTMDGDYNLPSGIGKEVEDRAWAYFEGKDVAPCLGRIMANRGSA